MFSNSFKLQNKLKKVLIISRRDSSKIIRALTDAKFELVNHNPDFIVCYGGDGTVLYSERTFPEIPKLIIKTSKACRSYDYSESDLDILLLNIKKGKFQICSEIKLETIFKHQTLIGLNEIQIHPKLPIYAIRFALNFNGKNLKEIIGDGVIFATPFGSTAYYEATGGKRFKNGIGISFNNPHNIGKKSFVIPEDSIIELTITRGPAWLLADNNENFIELDFKDVIKVKKSTSIANFIYSPL